MEAHLRYVKTMRGALAKVSRGFATRRTKSLATTPAALLHELEKCITPSLLLCMLPIHAGLSQMYCTQTEAALRSVDDDDLGVLAERQGRYSAPIQLGLVALYLRCSDHAGSLCTPLARDKQLGRSRLHTSSAFGLAFMGAAIQVLVEAELMRQKRSGTWPLAWLSPAAETTVSRERHGLWFTAREAQESKMTAQQRATFCIEQWLFSLKLVVFAPVLEELVYRRLILLNLCIATGSAPLAICLSSLGFGIGHLSSKTPLAELGNGRRSDLAAGAASSSAPLAIPIVETAFSVLASCLYLSTGRLAVPIVMHAIVNGSALVVEAPAAIPLPFHSAWAQGSAIYDQLTCACDP